jgi:hypothetical protein
MKYLHASLIKLESGTILKPRNDYEQHWGKTDFYNILEQYRPKEMLSHKESIFMCTSADDLDNAIGGEYIFEVEPLGKIEIHDLNWSTEVSILVSDNAPIEMIKEAALNYWNGTIHQNGELFEYMALSAKIIKVHLYESYQDLKIKRLKI